MEVGVGGNIELSVICITNELDIMFSKDVAKWKKVDDKKKWDKDITLWNTKTERRRIRGK